MTKISINQEDCINCSLCVNCAPETFGSDEKDFKCKIIKNGELVDSASVELSAEQLKQAKEAAENCPVQAIKLSE